MNRKKNLGTADRIARVALLVACLVIGFFWADRGWQILLYLVAVMFAIQASSSSCGVYALLGIDTSERVRKNRKNQIVASLAAILVLGSAGSYLSASMTRNNFLEDLSSLEGGYAQAIDAATHDNLANTTKAISNLNTTFQAFDVRYSKYHPLVIKYDEEFPSDLDELAGSVQTAVFHINEGDVSLAKDDLLKGSQIIEGIKERNGIVSSDYPTSALQ